MQLCGGVTTDVLLRRSACRQLACCYGGRPVLRDQMYLCVSVRWDDNIDDDDDVCVCVRQPSMKICVCQPSMIICLGVQKMEVWAF
jgi:hypothetical protein